MSEERLVEIETKIAFQEQTIKDLNDVLCEQQQEIEKLGSICDAPNLRKSYKQPPGSRV